MSRRAKLSILFALLVAAIALILWWLLHRTGASPAAQPVVTPSPAQQAQAPAVPAADSPQVEERVQASGAETVAKQFAERYGSFSTEASYGNLRDVTALATDAFAAQLTAQADAGKPGAEYYGVTTRVIALTADAMDDVAGTATFSVNTQRSEATGSAQNVTVKYQVLVVDLVKVGDQWKVSAASWK